MTPEEVFKNSIGNGLIRMVFSNPKDKDAFSQKMKVRPVVIREKLMFQITETVGSKESNTVKEIHKNLTENEMRKKASEAFPSSFLQVLVETENGGFTLLANKKGTVTVRKNSKVTKPSKAPLSHNREKQYLIPEGTFVPFMVDLGVMTKEGQIVKSKYDKYRQINRYLEFINDICDELPKDREITIIDFGCGKSYLTFALYYYLVCLNKRKARIVGLDLKTDVIRECNKLKDKYGYDGLVFIEGDVEHYISDRPVDMVISLHACDTATDYALYKGIFWKASVIMAVPCCQHELNKKIDCPELKGVLNYGILKDRVCAAFTDAMRANLLKEWGYDTQILEFIDMEHTPKNILIRAVRKKGIRPASDSKAFDELEKITGTELTLKKLLKDLREKDEKCDP
ncbi:MAG: SAM-dependent methyltransferase [Lachnospiraceae bacterium]|nr:SAM-dependent methyltransferase [Lachnospiraceae bacterium]